jgi:hypothetical protein
MRLLSPASGTVPMGVVNLSNFTAVHGMVYGLPFLSTTAADSQNFPLPPAIASVEDKSTFIPFSNGSGQTLAIGDVVCWKLDPTQRVWAELANFHNHYDPAGVVVFSSVADGENGWLAQTGRVINAKVLGSASLLAGMPLEPTLGQSYLSIASGTLLSSARYHFRILENHTTVATQLKRVRVDCTI